MILRYFDFVCTCVAATFYSLGQRERGKRGSFGGRREGGRNDGGLSSIHSFIHSLTYGVFSRCMILGGWFGLGGES
jgi:hypothetical protein